MLSESNVSGTYVLDLREGTANSPPTQITNALHLPPDHRHLPHCMVVHNCTHHFPNFGCDCHFSLSLTRKNSQENERCVKARRQPRSWLIDNDFTKSLTNRLLVGFARRGQQDRRDPERPHRARSFVDESSQVKSSQSKSVCLEV
jgi:hypothetical protein